LELRFPWSGAEPRGRDVGPMLASARPGQALALQVRKTMAKKLQSSKTRGRRKRSALQLEITSYQQQRRNLELHSQELTSNEVHLLDFLTLHAQGSANKVTLPVIHPQLFPGWKEVTAMRQMKSMIHRLREKGWKIGTSRRANDPGIFMIRTIKELNEVVRHYLRQAIEELRIIERLTGRGHYTVELGRRLVKL